MPAPSEPALPLGARPSAVDRWPSWGPPLLVASLSVVTFLTALRGGFVWDDLVFLPPGARLLGVSNPLEYFRTGIWSFANVQGVQSVPVYRPVSALFLGAFAPWLGASTFAWHLLPVALHAANSALVYAVARAVAPDRPRAAALVGAMLFAVLPCHVEAIAWIMAFPHPLATLFALGAALAQLRHARRGRAVWSVIAALLAVGAALSFEGGIVVAPLILVIEWVERRSRPPWYAWLPAGVSVVLPVALRARAIEAVVPLEPSGTAALRSLDFAAAYLRELVSPWPAGPYSSYPRWGVAGLGSWLIAVAVLAGAVWIAVRVPRERKVPTLLAMAWIAAGLALPILGAMNATPFFAPRSLYLASVGLSLLVAAAVPGAAWSGRFTRWTVGTACVALVVVGNVASAGWRDDKTVCEKMLKADPAASGPHLKLAILAQREGRAFDAEAHFRAADTRAATAAQRMDAREGLAGLLGSIGRLDEAATLFSEVLGAAPERSASRIGLGNIAFLRGNPARAAEEYRRALAVRPRSGEAAHNLAAALGALGDAEGAAKASALEREITAGVR